jgi:hypothetical protein
MLSSFYLTFAVYLQSGLHRSPVEAGIATLPFAVGYFVSSLASPPVMQRLGVFHFKEIRDTPRCSRARARNEARSEESVYESQAAAIMSARAVFPDPRAPITAISPGFSKSRGVFAAYHSYYEGRKKPRRQAPAP